MNKLSVRVEFLSAWVLVYWGFATVGRKKIGSHKLNHFWPNCSNIAKGTTDPGVDQGWAGMTFQGSGTGRELKKPIPETREREGNKKIHSQVSGMERNEKIPFPKLGNRKGMKKIHSQFSGKGIRGLHSWEWPGTGTGTGMGIIFYSLFWIFFFLGLPWKFFHWLCAPKSFPDSPTCIVTPKKILGQKLNVKFFTMAVYVEVT